MIKMLISTATLHSQKVSDVPHRWMYTLFQETFHLNKIEGHQQRQKTLVKYSVSESSWHLWWFFRYACGCVVVSDLWSWGHRFKSHPRLLCTNTNSACHPPRGRLMSSSLWATVWRPSVADWGGGISVMLHCGSNCPPLRAMVGCIHAAVSLAHANQLTLPWL